MSANIISQHQAPVTRGFLFVGGWVELGYKRNRKE
ncbi:uncharacterized protein METZ01_LOCUS423825, partial [marine metagenome]